jgi:hypothetical protein
MLRPVSKRIKGFVTKHPGSCRRPAAASVKLLTPPETPNDIRPASRRVECALAFHLVAVAFAASGVNLRARRDDSFRNSRNLKETKKEKSNTDKHR